MPTPETAPFGWDVWTHTEVVPKPDPNKITLHWHIVPKLKPDDWVPPEPTHPSYVPEHESEITLQLTADQEVQLSVSGQDSYGNPVDISQGTIWATSDESIVSVAYDPSQPSQALATAVGPVGSASVTCTNDANMDGTGDFIGSLAIDVVAGNIAEIEVTAGTPTNKGSTPMPKGEQGHKLGQGGQHQRPQGGQGQR